MGIFIGDIYIPFVSEFSVQEGAKTTQIIKDIDYRVPTQIAEFNDVTLEARLSGTVMKHTGSTRTADLYAEDISALSRKYKEFNYVDNYQGQTGWLSVESASVPKLADKPLSRDYDIAGNFMPYELYQLGIKSYPVMRSNPWGFTLGADDCDAYIALPIGSTYEGTFTTDTKASKDGTITYLKNNDGDDIYLELAGDETDTGEVKVYDDDDDVEANWIKIFNRTHKFEGDIVIDNGVYRIHLDAATDKVKIQRFVTGTTYSDLDYISIGSFGVVRFEEFNPDEVKIKLGRHSTITVRRGEAPVIYSTNVITFTALATVDHSTSTENYTDIGTDIYVAGLNQFVIASATKTMSPGTYIIYYDTVPADAEDIAHRFVVDVRAQREIFTR